MSEELSHDHDENRIGAMLRAVDADPLPPDRALLAALRERSGEAFAAALAVVPESVPPSSPDAERHIAPAPATGKPRNPMLTLAIRGLAVLAATAAAVAGLLTFAPSNSLSGATRFGEVLKELREAKTLQLQVTKEGKTAEVWVRAPGLVRRQETPQRYEIAAGSRLWKIDEQTNTVTTGDSPWFISPTKQIDLLGLLDLGVKDASPLLTARPVERAPLDGRDCFVYRVELPAESGQVEIEAMADAKSKQLVEIVARAAGAPRDAGPPLAELRLVAIDVPVDDSKFVVAKTLTDDGRIGKVTDAQGVVVVRPVLAQRWTPVCRQMQLRPGDWLRTDLRGANAVKLRLSSDVELTLGPASLLECVSPTQARLHVGEIQVNLPKQEHPQFELLAPRGASSQKFTAAGKSLVRVDRNEKLAAVKDPPKWLLGFEGTSSDESLGSLIVNLPDGRNEPLSIGYHKVSVEIRDQIARTTIEESFVNNTNARLEGIFNFPLPPDASISGFGMWIGNDLIEADVVEKQRAREIYETILREKRDPGLLEWTGGNIFKARVFPIEANSEKRVKIVYTQVLPLRADQYRYSYGLRSEMLRLKPLRELSLTVTVNSALPLKSVTCPTHSARISQTAHSAQVEFTAQEYTPSRDFEVLAQIDGRQSDVVVIPHRRGSDGYFLVQLTPPAPEGNWQREVIADGAPLNVVLLCDTSASMDSQKRREQAEFVATVLASLGEKDRFWLAACDVGTVWASPEPLAPTAENIAKAREFLDQRVSLGWTNLERAFGDVFKKSPAGSQVVYLGDGIVTAGQSDPAEFVNRLGRLIGAAGKGAEKPAGRVFHAVTVGNSFESTVLKGIAALGGGSVRSIGGDETPQTVALQWLGEITQPGLRDLNVEFRGLKVAAVYPDRLPNLAAGTQQILVGRYLPTGQDQQGEVIVTGHRGSETVRYAAKIDLKDAEAGNSFIPRLWARAHLDHLLAQGQSTAIHDQIIALSEEFHIITPYTSLLVLETDADRQRFGVKRQFEMRNGEQFFAAGHDNAQYELLQQQMKRAGDWRLGLRRQILASLSRLGRDPRIFQRRRQEMLGRAVHGGEWDFAGGDLPSGGAVALNRLSSFSGATSIAGGRLSLGDLGEAEYAGDYDGTVAFDFAYGAKGGEMEEQAAQLTDHYDVNGEVDVEQKDALSLGIDEQEGKEREPLADRDDAETVYDRSTVTNEGLDMPGLVTALSDESRLSGTFQSALEPAAVPMSSTPYFRVGKPAYWNGRGTEDSTKLLGWGGGGQYYRTNYGTWLDTLFPALAAPPSKVVPPRKRPKTWPPEALALADSLLRTESLLKLPGGIELRRVSEGFDPRWKRRSSHSSDLALYAPTAWLTRSLDLDVQTLVEYCNAKERGVYSLALLLGRSRASVAQELRTPPLEMEDWSLARLADACSDYEARVEKAPDATQAILVLKALGQDHELRLLIDMTRHVELKEDAFQNGKQISTQIFSDFVEVAGSWWPRRIIDNDGSGRTVRETTLDVQLLAPEKYQQRMATELAAKKDAQFLHLPGPRLKDARQHVADGSASFDDLVTMMLYDSGLQQWDDLLKHLSAAEKLAADKPGVRWLRTVILATIRRNEEARQRLLDEASKLVSSLLAPLRAGVGGAGAKQQDDVYLADFILGQAQSVTSPDEFLQFVESLKPVYAAQPADLNCLVRWQDHMLNLDDRLGRSDAALALRHTLAEQAPWDISRQIDYARHLLGAGQSAAAYAWLQQELDRPIEWQAGEDESLRTAIADLYRTEVRWADLLRYTTAWIARKPEYSSAYLQHLSALLYNDQLDAANALTQQWLAEARVAGKLAADKQARLDAAISFAEGSAYNVSFYRMDERWFEPLAAEARFFARSKRQFSVVQRVMQSNITESDAGDRLRGFFLKLLETESASLTPEHIRLLIGWTFTGRITLAEPLAGRKQLNASEVPDEVWKKIAATLRQRWAKAVDKPGHNTSRWASEKAELGEALRTIYETRFAESELLPFLRERVKSATPEQKPGYISALFEALLSHRWTDALEQEAFALWPQLTAGDDEPNQLFVKVPALYRLVDRMIAGRIAAAEQELHDKGNVDKLTRTELAQKKADIRKAARTGIAARLAAAAAADPKGSLAPWLRIERAYLDVELEQNLAQVETECWKILGEAPPNPIDPDAAEELTPVQLRQKAFDALLTQRALATVLDLAARRDAKPAAIDRALKYIDAGIAQDKDSAAAWRVMKFQFLVALDRPDDLDRQLREWIRSDVRTAPWRKYLALLVAERGKLDEAIGLFEAAEKDRLLTAADYRMLADWYMAVNRRDAYERSRVEAFKQMPEQRLYRIVAVARNLWNQTSQPLPSELDENTLFAYRAVFEKSSQPENYAWMLRDLYAACRDFRLLQILPDAALGRSPQQIYSYLQNLQSQVLVELRNEASADSILARIKKLRESGRGLSPFVESAEQKGTVPLSPGREGKLTSTDRRALDLLEALVERRSSEVLNQPGPHVAACLAALQRAFDRPWTDGEPRLMASFLHGLGTLPNPKLADEQLRELRTLAAHAPAGRDHLAIVNELAGLLFWSYNRHDEALDLMQVEVRSYEQAHGGKWPADDDEILGSYIGMFEGAGRHAAGETVLQKYLAHPEHEQQRTWLKDRLFALYNHALEHDGEVSLGRGDELFLNLIAAGLKQLDAAADENARQNLVSRLVGTFDIANRHKLQDTAVELRKFAFDTMPGVLKKQQSQYSNTAQTPTGVINEVLGPKAALEYIVARMEQYPPWLEVTWNNAWNTFGYELARRREEAAGAHLNIEALEPRVLKLTIRELKRDLRTGEARNPYLYRANNQYFWSAKAGDFANAAEEVYREYQSSGRRVLYIAQYFWNGLNRQDRAIEMLLVAHAAGVLDEGADSTLVDYLQQTRRYAESIPILEPLVKDHPDNISYRAQLMVAYFQSQRPEQLTALVKQTDAYFHQGGRWTSANISVFAEAALNCNLLDKAVGYYNEAISLYQRANPARGAADQTLSGMYQNLASAQSRLGHTKEAVEAASGAIVCWGPQYSQRTDALNRLKQVLSDAKDLDTYVAGLDKEVAESHKDSPILRKALGQVYQTRGQFGKAVAQYQLALDLQASDKEVEQALIACYDATGDKAAATRQLLKLLDLDAHNLALYQQLVDRLKDNEAEAERAATSLVEAGPNEAENHAALAELRQKQGRWNEAIDQWQSAADLRRLEPTNLVKLAEAQLHQNDWDAARTSIRKLERTEWPSRFSTIESDIKRLRNQLPK